MRSNVEGAILSGNLLMEKNKLGSLIQTLGATFTIDDDMPHLLFLDPGGAGRTVLLPAEARGLWFVVVNTADAAETLTVKEDAGSTTIGTIEQDTIGLFFCNGTTWYDLTYFAEAFLDGVTAGTVTASKAVVVDANKDIGTFRHVTMSGNLVNSNTDGATVKGIYYSGTIAVTVPSITDPDIAKVDVDVSSLTFAPAVGDAVIAIPLEALPTNCRLQGAWVNATDQVQIVYGSEGGNVTGGAKNHGFLFIDLT